MTLLFTLLVAVFGVFTSQNVINAELQLPYDQTAYQKIVSEAPWYSYCELPWSSFFDSSYFAKFDQLANEFNLRNSDLYQLHAILENNMPNLPYPNEYNILHTTASELKKEMDRRGIFSLPSAPSCHKYEYDQYSNYPTPVLTKRSPLVVTDYPQSYRSSTFPSHDLPYAVPTFSSGEEPYSMPTFPTDPYNSYPVDSPNSSYELQLAYKNLYVMLDQQMPNLPSSTHNNIINSVLQNTPLQYQDKVDDVTTQLTTNLRYVLGMAQQRIPPLY